MKDLYEHLLNQIQSAWRFRWRALAIAWVVSLGGWFMVSTQPDLYEANARVYVDTTSELRRLLDDQITESDVEAQLAFVRQSMLGRPQLETVARETDLHLNADTPEGLQRIVEGLRRQISISSTGGSRDQADNLYEITYQHRDREKASEVVNTLLNIFVEDTLGARREGSESARRFLREQIDEYEERLQEAEQRLADFQRENFDRLPGMQGGYFERLQAETNALENAEKELRLARSRLERIDQQLSGEQPRLAASEGEPPPGSLEARIREHESRLDELLLRYTDRHPDVQATRETLEQLRARQQMELEGAVAGPEGSSTQTNNPVFQSLRIAKNEAEAEVASLEADVADRRQRVERLEGLIDEMPQVEAELARLNRDYDVIHAQYQSLLNSLERERLSREAQQTEGIDFRVIDPPETSPEPVAPDRPLQLSLVLIAALGGGGGFALVLGQLRPVFHGSAMLREATGVPVVGSVSRNWSPAERRRRLLTIATFTVAFLLLLGASAAVHQIEGNGPGLIAYVEQQFGEPLRLSLR